MSEPVSAAAGAKRTPKRGEPIPLEQYFAEKEPESLALFEDVRPIVESLGDVEMRVTKSQVAFWRAHPFAWTWVPIQYPQREGFAPLVLTVGLRRRDTSARWKQVVEPRPGTFVHHLELFTAEQLDDEVTGWLREAWETAG